MNVRELIEELEGFDEDTEVRLAFQPSWPLQYHVADVIEVAADEHDVHESGVCDTCGEDFSGLDDPTIAIEQHLSDTAGSGKTIVYIAEGGQLYDEPYLPGHVARELGWK